MPFIKGQSGNPGGRGKGTVNKRSITAAAIAKYNKEHQNCDALGDIMGKMIDLAKEGDIQAAKLVIDRVEPSYKSILPSVTLGRMPKDLFKRGERILSLIASGDISPDIGRELLSSITILLKVQEQTELENRLKTLEDANAT